MLQKQYELYFPKDIMYILRVSSSEKVNLVE